MDIRKVSPEEKLAHLTHLKYFFHQIRKHIDTLEVDIQSEDLMTQTSAVWISGNLCNWFNDFQNEIRNIHKLKNEIQKQMMDSSNEKEIVDEKHV
ncbi:hypothetical protein UFOVP93_24 [uncultured Caudovirales phage]|uniref:Uncharacterized protein n=1 Tax=uncultured Caudovirales phage TaxID=2100421 RepID=A0A6J5L2Z4_9CAUD|nr:hypothetical protein UFOVP93_24 [uncultured Caudovirales phage]